ncbi:MAG TPA: hypothetical protein VGI14_06360 [Casimicrobiaceae bacterium]
MHRARWLVAVLAFVVIASALAQTQTRRVRGDVTAIDGNVMHVTTREGDKLAVKLDDKYTVTSVAKVGADAIKPGVYVGTATLPQPDGTQRALEVLVFPESGRGSGEGHYPWDLQPGSMMTNATVAEVVGLDKGRRMTLKYKGGEKVIVVPEGVPIVTFEPGDRAMLKPGAHVLFGATTQPDGSLTATRVNVGKDGLVPPM